MGAQNIGSQDGLLRHLLVPVAHVEDAEMTARALSQYQPGHITVTHVVEKGGGVADKTPVEQSESVAAEAFAVFRETFPDTEEELMYRRDVTAAIIELAEEIDATAIAFCPRRGGRIRRLLTGDKSLQLVVESDRPVIALPREDSG